MLANTQLMYDPALLQSIVTNPGAMADPRLLQSILGNTLLMADPVRFRSMLSLITNSNPIGTPTSASIGTSATPANLAIPATTNARADLGFSMNEVANPAYNPKVGGLAVAATTQNLRNADPNSLLSQRKVKESKRNAGYAPYPKTTKTQMGEEAAAAKKEADEKLKETKAEEARMSRLASTRVPHTVQITCREKGGSSPFMVAKVVLSGKDLDEDILPMIFRAEKYNFDQPGYFEKDRFQNFLQYGRMNVELTYANKSNDYSLADLLNKSTLYRDLKYEKPKITLNFLFQVCSFI